MEYLKIHRHSQLLQRITLSRELLQTLFEIPEPTLALHRYPSGDSCFLLTRMNHISL